MPEPEPIRISFDRSYRRPPGAEDLPYIQLFDASSAGLAAGADAFRVPLPLPRDGSLFVLRAIRGRDRVCSRMQLRFGEHTVSSHDRGFVMPPCWFILPERELGDVDVLSADFYGIAPASRSASGDVVYTAFLAMQGVRRVPLDRSSSPVFERRLLPSEGMPWSYAFELTVDWNHADSRPRQRHIEIRQFPFVWYGISIVRRSDYRPPAGEVAVLPYDYRMVRLASAPVPDVFVNLLSTGSNRAYHPCFPVPALLYPAGSLLCFDVQSLLLSSETPASYLFYFHGIRLRR